MQTRCYPIHTLEAARRSALALITHLDAAAESFQKEAHVKRGLSRVDRATRLCKAAEYLEVAQRVADAYNESHDKRK